ncbi:MAG: TonB-dependent receptor [Bacteroidota bacterium]
MKPEIRFLIFIFAVLFAQSSIAQTISGKVTDKETGEPVENIPVVIQGTNYGTYSDTNGEFILSEIPKGTHTVVTSGVRYEKARIQITVREEKEYEMNFDLQPGEVSIEAITISRPLQARDLIEMPRLESSGIEPAISHISEREIQKQGAETVVDAMKYIPGAMIETRGRKVKQFFSVRGQQYPYPDYALNGIWQREFMELPYFFSASEIENIEVIRSSSALLRGISEMAGIIDIVPKQYNQEEWNGRIEYGTFNSMRTHLAHGNDLGDISYAIGLERRETDGPEGRNAAETMHNVHAGVQWNPVNDLSLNLHFFHLDGERELAKAQEPAAERIINRTEEYNPYRSSLATFQAKYTPNSQVSTEFSASYADRSPTYHMKEPDEMSVSTDDQELTLNLIQSLKISSNNTLRIGGLYNHWLAPNGKRFYVGSENELSTYSAVIVDEHRIGNLTLDGGVRLRRTHIGSLGRFVTEGRPVRGLPTIKDEWEPVLYQATFGGAYQLSNLISLHLNMANGQIRPREGTLNQELNPLDNENRFKTDIGLQSRIREFGNINLVGFYTHQKDAIALSGDIYETEDGRIMSLYTNRDQKQLGTELEIKTQTLEEFVQLFANTTYMHSSKEESTEWEENNEIPNFIANGGAYMYFGNFDVNIFGKYLSSFENTRFSGPPPKPLGDFVDLNTTIGYNLNETNYDARIYLEINNILDQKYSTVVGYPDFGREFTLGIRMQL